MAEVKNVKINIDSNATEAEKDFKKFAKTIDNSNEQAEALNKTVSKTGDASKSASSGFNKMGTSIKNVGASLKAAGIGFIVGLLVDLRGAFESNQETANGFATVMETISIVFAKTVGAIIDAVKASYKATNGFDALRKVLGGLITIGLSPLKALFFSLKLGIQQLQLAWEKSFFGDGDPETIKELRKNIKATEEDLKSVGKSVVSAGKDIYNNFSEAVTEVVDLGKRSIEEVSKVSVSAAYDQAKALVSARNAAAIAAAQQAALVEQYDRSAEKLRQVRDEERNSIDERKAANDELLKVLGQQEKAMLAQAGLQIQAAQLEYNKNKTVENQVALTEALANRTGVLAQVEGLRSEQLANDLALQREEDELNKSRLASASELAFAQKKFDAERIEDEQLKIEKLIEIAKEEKRIELERLQSNIDLYKEGTQARLDAEIEFNTIKQELDNEVISLEDQARKDKEAKDKEAELKKKEAEKELNAQKIQAVQDGLSTIGNLTELFAGKSQKQQEKAFKIQKAVNIATAVLDTYKAANAALASAPPPFNFVAMAATITAGLANVKKITSTQFSGGSSSGDTSAPPVSAPSGGTTSPQAPSFNVVGNSGINQLAQINQQPVQAYVVSGAVTTAQSLDRNKIENATIG